MFFYNHIKIQLQIKFIIDKKLLNQKLKLNFFYEKNLY